MADPCAAQLAAADSCVSGDAGSCSCFTQPFMTSFPTEVTGAYRKTMAFEVPGTPEFCDKANFNVCTQFETTAGCCCGKEITEYTKCTFTNTLNVDFGSPGCEHTCGSDGEEAGGGGGSMMMIVVIVLLLGCAGGGVFYYRRRKRLGALAGKDVDTRESGKTEDSWGDIESGVFKNSNSKRGGFDSDSESDSDGFRDNKKKDKRGKPTKKSSKKGFDSESESDDSDFSGRGKKKKDKRGKPTKKSSKKGFDSESDDSDFSGRGKKKKDKRSKMKKRSTKKGFDSDSESDDSDSGRGAGGGKKGKLGRRNSKNNLVDSDSESSEDSVRNDKKSKKKKGGSRRGNSDSEDDESRAKKPTSSAKRQKATDESVRQARTILTSYGATKDQDISSQVQSAMKAEMTDVISNMKAQREVMEERLREAEKAAVKLRLEQESSRKQITELETKKQETEIILQETQMEAKMVRSSSCLELAEKEGEKIIVSAELEGVRKEREDMSKMIKNLEQAKQDMEGRLTQAKDEATTLKAQNEESTKRVSEVEKDRETMKLKLAQLQTTRGTIEARLKEAEEEGIQLKEERKEKSKQIKRCDNDDDIHQYQSQKNTISRELKKLETEREEMMTMVDRLNKSCSNVQSQIGVSRHSIMGMDGSLNSSHAMSESRSHSAKDHYSSNRPSHSRSKSPTRPNVNRRSGMGDRANSQPSLHTERPRENKSNSWLAKDILNRSQHGLEGGDRSRDSRPLNRSQHGIERECRTSRDIKQPRQGIERESRESRPVGHGSNHSLLESGSASGIQHRPAGWLGNEITNRSFTDLSAIDREPDPCQSRVADPSREMPKKRPKADPSVYSRRDHTDDQSHLSGESASLQMMREKHRASERRLRKAISKGQLNGSQRDLGEDGYTRNSTSNARW